MKRLACWVLSFPLVAAPLWKDPPKELPFGKLTVLELREEDPKAPPLPRPGEEKLGPLALRSVEPTSDGRGWKLAVQPLAAGPAVIPAMDLGDGRLSPELHLQVPRTVPYGAPWMGVGGGREDALPYVPFPLAWASLLLIPPSALAWLLVIRWRRRAPLRTFHQARRSFAHRWPPQDKERSALDAAHAAGRTLLAAKFGEDARAWGSTDFHQRGLAVWSTWAHSLDAARFGRKEPPFPALKELLQALEAKR